MLDSRGNEIRRDQIQSATTNLSQNYQGFHIVDPRLPGYTQTMQKKSTVKELLMMKRQKMNCSQEDNWVHEFKYAKHDTCASETRLPMFVPEATVNSSPPTQYPLASPENGHVAPEHLQLPDTQEQVGPTAKVHMSLFHWQIQQEAQRVGELSQEMLNMQDADGDTYVWMKKDLTNLEVVDQDLDEILFLHIAVAKGKRALAYVLAEKMAKFGSVDMKEHNGQTALQIAAATNQHLIVQDMLALGAQINTRDYWGRSPLHVCAEKGHLLSLQSIWRTLTWKGQLIEIEMFNYDGLTPLHAAVLSHNAIIKELRCLENPCLYMETELLQRRQMFTEIIKTLLHMGASLGTKDLKSGRTCLHMASEEANLELFQLFLDKPTSLSFVNVKTFSGNTALHIVSSLQNQKTQVEVVKLLTRNGADPGIRNFENELPSQLVPEGPIGEKVRQILRGKYVQA